MGSRRTPEPLFWITRRALESVWERVGGFIDKICHASANLWALVPCSDFASRSFLALSEFCPASAREGRRGCDVINSQARERTGMTVMQAPAENTSLP